MSERPTQETDAVRAYEGNWDTKAPMTPCPKDSPLMREWENYNQSDEYANSFKWAAHEEHRKGSMWAAFMAGFLAANPSGAKPMTHAEDGENNEGDLKRERDEARANLEKLAQLAARARKSEEDYAEWEKAVFDMLDLCELQLKEGAK